MTLTELAVPLRSRIWDLTDGRLVNGEWTRYDWKPNSDLKILEPFGGTVAEFETAMRTEENTNYVAALDEMTKAIAALEKAVTVLFSVASRL